MKFRNEYWFMSNMYPCNVKAIVNGNHYVFSSSEALFQALKDPSRVEEFVGIDGFAAKALGKKVKLRADWPEVQVKFMRQIVAAKFEQNPKLMTQLKRVTCEIVEENTWGDTFWGRCQGQGQNMLGKILMEVRDSHEVA